MSPKAGSPGTGCPYALVAAPTFASTYAAEAASTFALAGYGGQVGGKQGSYGGQTGAATRWPAGVGRGDRPNPPSPPLPEAGRGEARTPVGMPCRGDACVAPTGCSAIAEVPSSVQRRRRGPACPRSPAVVKEGPPSIVRHHGTFAGGATLAPSASGGHPSPACGRGVKRGKNWLVCHPGPVPARLKPDLPPGRIFQAPPIAVPPRCHHRREFA